MTRLPDPATVLAAIKSVDELQDKLYREQRALAAVCNAALAILMPVGMIVGNEGRQAPAWRRQIKVVSGNGRGARSFVLVSTPAVHLQQAQHITLATWYAEAVPISPTTGKPMSGRTHGAGSKDTVRIASDLVSIPFDAGPQGAAYAEFANAKLMEIFASAYGLQELA